MTNIAATAPKPLAGALWAMAGVTAFSTNDMGIKFMSSDYPLHEIVLIRSVIGTVVFLAVIMPLVGGPSVLKTRRLGMHLIRGACVVFANLCYFLGLAALPIADSVAIAFVSPLLLACASVLFLGEKVGPWRWAAIGIGFVGVMVVVRPGTASFQIAALLPILSACGYAALHTFTRHLRATESAGTMAFYIQVVFIISSGAIGLALGDGRHAGASHPSVEFLMRGWIWPRLADWPLFLMIGAGSIIGGYFISQAYRLSEAALVAPFEYIAMPLAIFWGVVVFGTWPGSSVWLGIAMIVGGGLLLIWRETVQEKTRAAATTLDPETFR